MLRLLYFAPLVPMDISVLLEVRAKTREQPIGIRSPVVGANGKWGRGKVGLGGNLGLSSAEIWVNWSSPGWLAGLAEAKSVPANPFS